MSSVRSAFDLGCEVMGPLFYRFLYQLWLHQLLYEGRGARALFMARGGLRIRHFYERFLARNRLPQPLPHSDLYVSRMAAFQAAYPEDPVRMGRWLAAEYQGQSAVSALRLLLPAAVFGRWLGKIPRPLRRALEREPLDAARLARLASPEAPGGTVLAEHFRLQQRLLRAHLAAAMDGSGEALLVDTGWSGTIFEAIRTAVPGAHLTALFFGRHNYGRPDPPWFPCIVGIEIEDNLYVPARPQTSLVLHRHLIEGACEVRGPSVTGYEPAPGGGVQVLPGTFPESSRVPADDEPLARGICAYIDAAPDGIAPAAIQLAAARAARRLRRLVCYPRRDEAAMLTVANRSADFGKDVRVPVLLPPARPWAPWRKYRNIRTSLWQNGQAAIEFPRLRRIPQTLLTLRATLPAGTVPWLLMRGLRRLVAAVRPPRPASGWRLE